MTVPSSPDTPSLPAGGRDDTLEPATVPAPAPQGAGSRAGSAGPGPSDASGDQDVDQLVTRALRTLVTPSGADPERSYQEGLLPLRERADAAVRAVAARYDDLEEQRYLERWGLVQLLTDLRVGAAAPVLRQLVTRPIPPERSPDPAHGISTVGEEIILRTTAVEGLARLAGGDAGQAEQAREVLVELLGHPAFSVRRAAVQAITDTGDEALARQARARLEGTPDERLLSIRRVAVQDVPQAQGGRFLADGETPPPA